MAEQWECCYLDNVGGMTIFTPEKYEEINIKDFIKRHSQEISGKSNKWVAYCLLLSDGWEPMGSSEFRRKRRV